ncbi:MAG: glycoside hydrolase family 13 protein, partial [Merismopedia sp. SIO2A8]|nr:glycoside hydrolase family 13 protein [Merismopedia sp. SIO2A8]
PWDTPPTPQGYKGGDLWGIVEHLDYLQELGITALYLTPIFQSACNHRYHTHDYYTVDPLLGGNNAFRDLLDAAHQREMKVILDGVFNHASRGFFFFNDILENGPYSPWLDWFKVQDWPLSAYDGSLPANYVSWVNNRALPQFNHANPQVREYIMQVAEYWLKFGIDGWRLDVPSEIQAPGFWQEFRDRTKAINPEAYIVGEIWDDASQWLDGTQFDGVMNYLFTELAIAFAVGNRVVMEHVERPHYRPYPALDAARYADGIDQLLQRYSWNIQLTQLNLLASHDTARLFTIAGGDATPAPNEDALAGIIQAIELATFLQMTFPGAPCIYYGDEVGLGGGLDPDCRRSFPQKAQWNRALLTAHQQLIQLRHQHIALRIGSYETVLTEGFLYGFIRSAKQEQLLVVVNAGTTEASGGIERDFYQLSDHPAILYGSGKCTVSADEWTVVIPPISGMVIDLGA